MLNTIVSLCLYIHVLCGIAMGKQVPYIPSVNTLTVNYISRPNPMCGFFFSVRLFCSVCFLFHEHFHLRGNVGSEYSG